MEEEQLQRRNDEGTLQPVANITHEAGPSSTNTSLALGQETYGGSASPGPEAFPTVINSISAGESQLLLLPYFSYDQKCSKNTLF